ncbi:MAG: TssN family type VI secretion system protein [Tannerella sp.]|nr:TssN family type VI secretion system protein [Tannerella sp.]
MVLTLPTLLGFLDYGFMPYGYISLSSICLPLGWYNDKLLPRIFKKEIKYRVKIIYTLFQLLVGMLLFSLVFNLCSELPYGIWASTSMLSLVLISLLVRSYELFIHIPASVYKVWEYDKTVVHGSSEDMEQSVIRVVSVELFKRDTDREPIRITAKVPEAMLFGEWMKILFDDYNKRSSHSPIDISPGIGRIFYVKSVLAPKRYIDYERTVKENGIREKHLIVVESVKQDSFD